MIIKKSLTVTFFLSAILLFCINPAYADDTCVDNTLNSIVKEQGVEIVQEIPEGITPIIVKDYQELELLLQHFDNIYNNGAKHEVFKGIETNNLENQNFIKQDIGIRSHTNPMNGKHSQTIFKLNDIGGKIISEVSYYFVSYSGTRYFQNIDYHDVSESGIYGFQEISYDNSVTKAVISRDNKSINVRVKGETKVYIGISGGGASGNLVLKTYKFDESYSIR